jgi:hypothetical protein
MEGAAAEVEVVGPPGWFTPVIPAGANILSESPIAYTLDNLLTGASATGRYWVCSVYESSGACVHLPASA